MRRPARRRPPGGWSLASADQHRDAVHRIAAVALRIPGARDVRLHLAFGVGAARPDLEIPVRWQDDAQGPALPVVLVLGLSSLARIQVAPKSIETSTCFTVL